MKKVKYATKEDVKRITKDIFRRYDKLFRKLAESEKRDRAEGK